MTEDKKPASFADILRPKSAIRIDTKFPFAPSMWVRPANMAVMMRGWQVRGDESKLWEINCSVVAACVLETESYDASTPPAPKEVVESLAAHPEGFSDLIVQLAKINTPTREEADQAVAKFRDGDSGPGEQPARVE